MPTPSPVLVPCSSSHLRLVVPSSGLARVCRAYGCDAPARELGFCAGCVDDYQRRRAGDELRLARLATRLAAWGAPGRSTGLDCELALQVAAERAFDAHHWADDEGSWRRALVALLADCAIVDD